MHELIKLIEAESNLPLLLSLFDHTDKLILELVVKLHPNDKIIELKLIPNLCSLFFKPQREKKKKL